jgi:drug/metabolite transporter (DMT)-like permease
LQNNNVKVQAALWGVAIIHGANYTIAKEVMPLYIGPFGFIVLRQSFAVLAFFLIGLFYGGSYSASQKDWTLIIISAFFGAALNMLTFFKGLSMTSPIQASLIMVTTPIIVTALSRVFLKDKLNNAGWMGLILGFTGTAWLILNGQPGHQFKVSAGDLFIFINALSYAIYLVISKPLLSRYHFIWLTKWLSLFGLLFTIPFGFHEVKAIEWIQIPPGGIAAIIYVLMFTTLLSFLLFGYALTHTTTSVVSSYIYLQPLLATAFAILVARDNLTWIKVLSGLVIFTGVWLVNKGKQERSALQAENKS